ncbi:MAG: hypothetical protein A2284_04335 [Deltaproteobacteria bacterium RIFOXYA12_FULL_61_11]|nr:MAG: hypothetical protein A2284_04335 [Deltaproteobacteria bacterium RIFOXYA12_FULL_61_11]
MVKHLRGFERATWGLGVALLVATGCGDEGLTMQCAWSASTSENAKGGYLGISYDASRGEADCTADPGCDATGDRSGGSW